MDKKNNGCINCKYCNKSNIDGAECYKCTCKSAWKKSISAIFGKVLINLCGDLNKNLDCPHYNQNKNTTTKKEPVTGGTGKSKFIKTN